MGLGDLPVFVVIIVVPLFYFLPWIIAAARKHNNRSAIAMLNAFAGWTVLGWFGALVWSCTDNIAASKPKVPREWF